MQIVHIPSLAKTLDCWKVFGRYEHCLPGYATGVTSSGSTPTPRHTRASFPVSPPHGGSPSSDMISGGRWPGKDHSPSTDAGVVTNPSLYSSLPSATIWPSCTYTQSRCLNSGLQVLWSPHPIASTVKPFDSSPCPSSAEPTSRYRRRPSINRITG